MISEHPGNFERFTPKIQAGRSNRLRDAMNAETYPFISPAKSVSSGYFGINNQPTKPVGLVGHRQLMVSHFAGACWR